MKRRFKGLTIAALLAGTAGIVHHVTKREAVPPAERAMREMKQLAFAGATQYRVDHRACPTALAEVAVLVVGAKTTDPWGTGYQFRCGDGALGFPMRSAGPDRRFDTRDDIYVDRMFFVFDMHPAKYACSPATGRCE